MATALITVTLLGLVGLGYSAFLGYTVASSADLLGHTTLGIFCTLILLLAHSMTMFYLIGKGKAVREAAAEGGLSPSYYAAIASARRPVFSIATVAMALTMVTAILGGGVDTGFIPSGVHGVFALSAIAGNAVALRTELAAMLSSAHVTAEVDQLLAEQP